MMRPGHDARGDAGDVEPRCVTAHAKWETRTFPALGALGRTTLYPAPDGAVWFVTMGSGMSRHSAVKRLDPACQNHKSAWCDFARRDDAIARRIGFELHRTFTADPPPPAPARGTSDRVGFRSAGVEIAA